MHDILIVPDSTSPNLDPTSPNLEVSIHRRIDHFSALKVPLSQTNLQDCHRQQRWPMAHTPNSLSSSGSGVLHRHQSRPVSHLSQMRMDKKQEKECQLSINGSHRQQPRPMVAHSDGPAQNDHGMSLTDTDGSHRQQPRPVVAHHCHSKTDDSPQQPHHSNLLHQEISSSSDSSDIHRQQPRPVDPHSSQGGISRTTYTAEQLLNLRPKAGKIARKTRKRIFESGIWKPKNDNSATNPPPMPKNNKRPLHTRNLTRICKEPTDYITVGCVNARSLRNKSCDFHDNIVDDKYDLCLITETWLKSDDDVIQIESTPTGYTLQHLPRADRSGGGVGLISKLDMKPQMVQSTSNYSSFEHCAWTLNVGSDKMLVAVIYRPPYSEKNKSTVNNFLDEFSTYLESIITSPLKLLIGGDFNFHMENKSCADTSKFLELLDCHDLMNHVWRPTHDKGHTLDLLITRKSDEISLQQTEVTNFLSDHAFVKSKIKINKQTHELKNIQFRQIKKININQLKNDISTSALCNMNDELSASEKAALYDSTLSKLLDAHAPVISKTIKIKHTAPWYTNELRSLKRTKRKKERAWRKSMADEDYHTFKTARQDYIDQCNNTKSAYYSNEVQKCGNDQRKLFKLIKHLTNTTNASVYPPSGCDEQLGNEFGKFFIEKVDKIMDEIEDVINTENIPDYCQYATNLQDTQRLTDFRKLTTDEVTKLIMKSKTKSSILDPIPTSILKECLDEIIIPITNIINSSLSEGLFPSNWKTAVVIPLLKKAGLELILKNFRPVSNLSYMSKLVEKAGLAQYVDHLSSIGKFSSNNSAYKDKHSTETLLVKIHSDIVNSIDNQSVTLLVLLDLSAAFDTVNLDIITNIFRNHFNITGNVLTWFQSYLQNRDQRILINTTISNTHKLKYGVPQGSCAGPVIFLGYLCSLYDIIEKHLPSVRVGGYADDHQLYLSYKPGNNTTEIEAIKKLSACIADVRAWMLSHKLKINDTKTEFMILGTPQQLSKVAIESISVGNSSITPVKSLKNLGIVFDQHLNMSTHVNQVCQKGYYQLKRIRQIRKYLDKPATEKLVHAFVTSNIDYCNSLLYGTNKYVIDKLQKLQNAAARVICGARRYDPITPLLKDLHWLPVSYRISFKIALLTHKCLNNQAPAYLKDLLAANKPGRELRSSHQNKLKVPFCKTKIGSRAFTSAAPEIWNPIPENIKSLGIDKFKKQLKTHYFKQAFKSK